MQSSRCLQEGEPYKALLSDTVRAYCGRLRGKHLQKSDVQHQVSVYQSTLGVRPFPMSPQFGVDRMVHEMVLPKDRQRASFASSSWSVARGNKVTIANHPTFGPYTWQIDLPDKDQLLSISQSAFRWNHPNGSVDGGRLLRSVRHNSLCHEYAVSFQDFLPFFCR